MRNKTLTNLALIGCRGLVSCKWRGFIISKLYPLIYLRCEQPPGNHPGGYFFHSRLPLGSAVVGYLSTGVKDRGMKRRSGQQMTHVSNVCGRVPDSVKLARGCSSLLHPIEAWLVNVLLRMFIFP